MNKVILMGRLTSDPEVRYTQNNTSVAKFTLAINRVGKPQEGQPTADFFRCVAWKQTADFVGKYFKKGQQVLVEGNLRNNDWTDKEGNKRRDTEIHIDHAYFAEGRNSDSGRQDYGRTEQNASETTTEAVAVTREPGEDVEEGTDDLPF